MSQKYGSDVADVNAKETQRGTTAMMWAADEGQWEFYALLARGSGIRARTTEIPFAPARRARSARIQSSRVAASTAPAPM